MYPGSKASRAGAGVLGVVLLAASARPLAAQEALAAVRVRSGPAGALHEVLVRGEGPLRFAGLVRTGRGGERSRLGLAVPALGGWLHAGALRAVGSGTAGSASLLRPPWPGSPSLSVTASEEGIAWVGRAAGLAWARRGAERPSASAWVSSPRVRLAGRSGADPAARLDARGPHGERLLLRVDRSGPVGLLAVGASGAAFGVAFAGGWDARVGIRGPLAGGGWRAEASIGAERTARSDLRLEWLRSRPGGELRVAGRVNREGSLVRSSARIRFEVRIVRGAVGAVTARRELTGGREVAVELDARRRASTVRARLVLPERRGRRLDLQWALGGGPVRARLRLRIEMRRPPDVELAVTRRFALTSPGGRDRIRGIAEARD